MAIEYPFTIQRGVAAASPPPVVLVQTFSTKTVQMRINTIPSIANANMKE